LRLFITLFLRAWRCFDRCGLDAGYLCRIEKRRMNVTFDTVAKICEALGLRLEAVSGSEMK
jgi:DNA-binding phage protein